MLEDIVKALGLGCIVVADAGLGTINHVVLTVEYLRARDIRVYGIILNNFKKGDVLHEDNKVMCACLTDIPVLACVGAGEQSIDIDVQQLISLCS
jgi:dethiobiotin synthetase